MAEIIDFGKRRELKKLKDSSNSWILDNQDKSKEFIENNDPQGMMDYIIESSYEFFGGDYEATNHYAMLIVLTLFSKGSISVHFYNLNIPGELPRVEIKKHIDQQ